MIRKGPTANDFVCWFVWLRHLLFCLLIYLIARFISLRFITSHKSAYSSRFDEIICSFVNFEFSDVKPNNRTIPRFHYMTNLYGNRNNNEYNSYEQPIANLSSNLYFFPVINYF